MLVDAAKLYPEKCQILLGPSSEATDSEKETVRRILMESISRKTQDREKKDIALENLVVVEDDRRVESDIEISDLNETEKV
jgi:hypothetical protein